MHQSAEQLFVPIKATRIAGVSSICTARVPGGVSTALAFRSIDRLVAAMGPQQEWAVLCESALRTMVAPIGITRIQVDADRVVSAVNRPPRSPLPQSPLPQSPLPQSPLPRSPLREPADEHLTYPPAWLSSVHAAA